MTDLTGKQIANTYKNLITVQTSVENSGFDGNLRPVQSGDGTSSALKLSQTDAAFAGDVSVFGNLRVAGVFEPGTLNATNISAVDIGASSITTQSLTAETLIFQDVSVSSLRTGNLYAQTVSADTISATNINTTNITVNGDGVATSAALTSVEAIISSNVVFILNAQASVLAVLAGLSSTDTGLQNNIDFVSATVSAVNTQVGINSSQIATLSTSIAANASAITSINTVIGTLASIGTSAALESRIASVSSTMATSIANVSSALESRISDVSVLTSNNATAINVVSAALVSTAAVLTTNINTVSAGLSIANVSIAANASAIAAVSALIPTSLTDLNISDGSNGQFLQTNGAGTFSFASVTQGVGGLTAITAGTNIAFTVNGTSATNITTSGTVNVTGVLPLAGGTMTGSLILNADPTVDLGAATKQYVDNLTAAGIHFHEAVRFEQPGPLTVTYDNGTDGVGATLTNAGTQAILVVDGVTASNDDRILIYEQVSATQNGVYVVTTIGSPSTNWILTRSADTDTAGPGSPDSLDTGSYFFVTDGNTGAGESYICNTPTSIVFGTTDITFVQFSSAIQYTAGTNINISGDRIISTSGVPTNAELAAVSATLATSIANVSATLESRIATVSSTMATSIANVSATLESRIATVSSTLATSIANVSATLESRIATVSSTLATSISNHLPLSGGTLTGDVNSNSRIRAAGSTGLPAFAHSTDTDTGVNPDGSGNIQFTTQGSEAMRIDSDGNLLVGTTSNSPTTTAGINLGSNNKLHATRSAGTSGYFNRLTSDGSIVEFAKDGTTVGNIGSYSGVGLTIASGSELRFFTSTSNEDMRLETDGDLHVDGNVVAYSTTISDKRLKKNIQPIEDALWKVNQINGCTFTYLKDDRKSAGLIAQDLEKVLPSAVIEDKAVFHGEEGETYKTVQYDQVIGLLVEAIKELNAKVERLENGSSK